MDKKKQEALQSKYLQQQQHLFANNSGGKSQEPISKQITETEDDIFKLLITTDNHLGYKESDKLIGNDSFYSFNETLQMYFCIINGHSANDKKVDFVLLGGDLFHDSTPSANTQ